MYVLRLLFWARNAELSRFPSAVPHRGSLIVADIIVLVATWMKTFRQWLDARRLNMPLSVSTCLLGDGECAHILAVLKHTTHRFNKGTTYFLYVFQDLSRILSLPNVLFALIASSLS